MPQFILLTGLFFIVTHSVQAQSCCSGGVPLSGNLGLPVAEEGSFQTGVSYDYNRLNNLKSGWNRLDDDSRLRLTHTVLTAWGLSLSEKLSIEGLFSYVYQKRTVRQISGKDIAQANGLGDAVLLVNYSLFSTFSHSISWRAAVGVKAPIGDFSRKDERGLVLNAELQPGSGAWDLIFWTQWTKKLQARPSATIHWTGIYTHRGKNSTYLGSETYQFGNEIYLSGGITDRVAIANTIWDTGITFRYRQIGSDKFNGADLPATGGKWWFVVPGLTWWVTPDFSFSFSSSIPFLAYVKETQFSPSFRLNAGFFYRFSIWKNNSEGMEAGNITIEQ